MAIGVKHLGTGESHFHRGDEPMPTASLIKFPVMVEAYRQAEEGKLDLKKPVTLRDADKVPGSGILQQLSEGATFPVRDAVRLMIALSDNTATNLVLDQVGIGSTAATMERLGYPHTKIHSKVFRRDTSLFKERSERFGLGSTTPREMVGLLEALNAKKLVSAEASDAMLGHLRACQDHARFTALLPPGIRAAMKTGAVDDARTAAGILFTPSGPIALCVMTAENEDQRWTADNAGERLCQEVARAVYRHFHPAE